MATCEENSCIGKGFLKADDATYVIPIDLAMPYSTSTTCVSGLNCENLKQCTTEHDYHITVGQGPYENCST